MKKAKTPKVEFTREMKRDYTILIPDMLGIHIDLIRDIFVNEGYKAVRLTNQGRAVVDEGLKYVHNDTCYPALLVIGQMLDAIKSGKYDVNKIALLMTQTGGGCRASNYIHLIRKALSRAGFAHIPVISLNMAGLEKNSGFKLTLSMLRKGMAAVAYGDILMLLSNQTRPYEINAGETDALTEKWHIHISEMFKEGKGYKTVDAETNIKLIAAEFAAIPVNRVPRVKVGVVGEIYVKYSGLANNNLERFLAEQGCEVMVPGLLGFIQFFMNIRTDKYDLYGGGAIMWRVYRIASKYLEKIENIIGSAARENGYTAPAQFSHVAEEVTGIISRGVCMGEGWLLPAEMLDLIELGYDNIVCAQPFGCLPNHIAGKGMIRKIRTQHESANIVAIDYDPGATAVNQENRIKLMLAVARERLEGTAPAAESAGLGEHTAEPLVLRETAAV